MVYMLKSKVFTKYQTRGSSYHWAQIQPNIFSFNAYVSARYQQIVGLIPRKKNQKILDVGCGDGALLGLISRKTNASLYGVDSNQASLNYAATKVKAKFVFSQAEKLLFKDKFFDLVIAAEMIEHLLYPEIILAEIKRVLKPGGKLILTTPVKLGPVPEDKQHVQEFTPEELSKLLKKYFRTLNITTSHPFWLKKLYLTTLLRINKYHLDLFRWLINIFALIGYNPFIKLKGSPSQQLAVCSKIKVKV